MKTVFLIGLLAALAAANSDILPTGNFLAGHPFGSWSLGNLTNILKRLTEEPTTTFPPFPLPTDKKSLQSELQQFGKNFISYTLNLKNFDCSDACFPLDTNTLDGANLLIVKYLLQYFYDSEYERILHYESDWKSEAAQLPDFDLSLISSEMENGYKEIFKTWRDMWSSLDKYFYDVAFTDQNTLVWTFVRRYFTAFGPKRISETHKRFVRVFGRALNKTTVKNSLSQAVEQYELFQRNALHNYPGSFEVLHEGDLRSQIHRIIQQLHDYIYDQELPTIDYMGKFIYLSMHQLSLRTLFAFRYYLQDVFGHVLAEIPAKLDRGNELIMEKRQIVWSLDEMMRNTLDTWFENVALVLDDYTTDKKTREDYNAHFYLHAEVLQDVLSVEDLHRVYRRALPILGWMRKGMATTTTPAPIQN